MAKEARWRLAMDKRDDAVKASLLSLGRLKKKWRDLPKRKLGRRLFPNADE